MVDGSDRESCGRCGVSSTVGVTDGHGTNPWSGERIEIDERTVRTVSWHVVLLGKLKRRLNTWIMNHTFGR